MQIVVVFLHHVPISVPADYNLKLLLKASLLPCFTEKAFGCRRGILPSIALTDHHSRTLF